MGWVRLELAAVARTISASLSPRDNEGWFNAEKERKVAWKERRNGNACRTITTVCTSRTPRTASSRRRRGRSSSPNAAASTRAPRPALRPARRGAVAFTATFSTVGVVGAAGVAVAGLAATTPLRSGGYRRLSSAARRRREARVRTDLQHRARVGALHVLHLPHANREVAAPEPRALDLRCRCRARRAGTPAPAPVPPCTAVQRGARARTGPTLIPARPDRSRRTPIPIRRSRPA